MHTPPVVVVVEKSKGKGSILEGVDGGCKERRRRFGSNEQRDDLSPSITNYFTIITGGPPTPYLYDEEGGFGYPCPCADASLLTLEGSWND